MPNLIRCGGRGKGIFNGVRLQSNTGIGVANHWILGLAGHSGNVNCPRTCANLVRVFRPALRSDSSETRSQREQEK